MFSIHRFIGGPGRTNTTILIRILGTPQSVGNFQETSILVKLFNLKRNISKNGLENLVNEVNDECFKIFQDSNWWEIKNFRKFTWKILGIDLNPFNMENEAKSLYQNLCENKDQYMGKSNQIVDVYLNMLLSWIGNKKYVLKMPGIEIDLAHIAKLNDVDPTQWRIVYTTKNLLDVAASWFRDQIIIGDEYNTIMSRLEERMLNSCKSIIQLPPQSVFFLKDLDFHQDTEKTIRKITQFLDIEFDEKSLRLYDARKRRLNEGLTDKVTDHYHDRLQNLRVTCNQILGKDMW